MRANKPVTGARGVEGLAVALMASGLLVLICAAAFFLEKMPISLLVLGIGLALAGNIIAPDPASAEKSRRQDTME